MSKSDVNRRFQQVIGPICALCLMLYFIYHIIQGERGILSWLRLQQKISDAEQQLTVVQEEQEILERRVQLLRPDSLDPDMLEERARKVLNFAKKDEVVIYDKELNKSVEDK